VFLSSNFDERLKMDGDSIEIFARKFLSYCYFSIRFLIRRKGHIVQFHRTFVGNPIDEDISVRVGFILNKKEINGRFTSRFPFIKFSAFVVGIGANEYDAIDFRVGEIVNFLYYVAVFFCIV
jgi:hypothetical protein